jgi:hypothetical protein
MVALTLRDQLLNEFDKLTPEKQERVLNFTKSLSSTLPPGIPGEVLLQRAREINFDPNDLAEMQRAIEEGCERIESDE